MNPTAITQRPTEAPPSPEPSAPPAPLVPPALPTARYTQAELNVLHAVNPFVCALLRSPLHRLVSGRLLLLTYTGRKSGRAHTIPLGYTRLGDDLLVFTHHAWWRNLRGGAPVTLRLDGRLAAGRAEVVDDPAAVLAEVERLVAALGAKEAYARAGVKLAAAPSPTRDEIAQALVGTVAIRVTPEAAPERSLI
jgi:hypothetical protein